jgi:hypothetical protein
VELESKGEKAKIDYSFSRIVEGISPYKCVFSKFNRNFAHWLMSPCKGSVEIKCTKAGEFGIPEELNNRKFESLFAYDESVRIGVPLVSSGWNWAIVSCLNEEGKQEHFVGLMDLFLSQSGKEFPVNLQLYSLDLSSGEFEMHGDAKLSLEGGSLVAESFDGKIVLKIARSGEERKRLVRSLSADIDYSAYSIIGEAVVGGKKYSVIGTAESAGKKSSYWV